MKLKFRNHLNEILIFSALLLILLSLVRVTNVLAFGDWLDTRQSMAFLDDFLFRGFRFDLKLLASILIVFFWIPVILFSWFIPQKLFSSYLVTVLKLNLVLLVYIIFVDIGYIFYFQRPIDVLIFGLFEDDTRAIMSTILDNYKILLFFVVFIISTWLILTLFKRLLVRYAYPVNSPAGNKWQLLAWLFSFLLLATLARGSLDSFPLQRKHASVSDNSFLNAMVMNGPFNLYYAYRDKKVNNQAIFQQV